jgi:hypothetical protein
VKVSAPDIRYAETRDALVAVSDGRVGLFNDLIEEARRGAGFSDVGRMVDLADGRERLSRAYLHLSRKLVEGR